jgi:transcriptional regulator with XRE-family HTH domain
MKHNKVISTQESGRRLKELRFDLGMSQTDFGVICKRTQAAIGALENGSAYFRLYLAKHLQENYGISAKYLMGFADGKYIMEKSEVIALIDATLEREQCTK